MAELAVVRRYAHALFETARRAGTVDQVEEDLKAVHGCLVAIPRLARALRAPTVSAARKKALLGQAFSTRVEALTLRFLRLVIDRRRPEILAHVYPEFRRLADEWRNVLAVEVSAAVPLTDAERDSLAAALHRRTGKTIQLQVSVDATMLGGVVVRMGDTIVDGSVRSRLAQIKARLLAGRAS